MKYYCYNDFDENNNPVIRVMSEEEIIARYWDTWYNGMCKKFSKEIVDKEYSKQDCIDDWIVIHWAWESE